MSQIASATPWLLLRSTCPASKPPARPALPLPLAVLLLLDPGVAALLCSMQGKPAQMTPYGGMGYEILAQGGGPFASAADAAVKQWMNSPVHNAVILSLSPWNGMPWQALGCSLGTRPLPNLSSTSGYWVASCWFGFEADR